MGAAMGKSEGEVILDEVATPDGALELVAFQSKGTVGIGIRPKGWHHAESPTRSAFELRTGSELRYVEATCEVRGAWGVVYGAVAPEVERVEVRNEQRAVFPARIVPFPLSFGEDYRAAWGLADECETTCELIGYDGRDRLIAPHTIRTGERREPSAGEALERIREHCDNGLRYFTWALKRMPSIPDQAGHVGQVQNLRSALALVLAYVEGASDERNAMFAREEILLRYTAAIEAEGWEPPFASGPESGPTDEH